MVEMIDINIIPFIIIKSQNSPNKIEYATEYQIKKNIKLKNNFKTSIEYFMDIFTKYNNLNIIGIINYFNEKKNIKDIKEICIENDVIGNDLFQTDNNIYKNLRISNAEDTFDKTNFFFIKLSAILDNNVNLLFLSFKNLVPSLAK